ncbi:MAG: glycosyltransferase family 2 protein [Gemmatimonadota bacterium]|nr:glycosyltransferase family 2 protein [Gemmatimonadota bacterium]MDE3006152.1 glycosyltransferase family 2 protein [Gemmatimonadota bacterium]MDE3013656.1 glycosyltransferase family 2 protein [Gemmatimonadota bacterium]
MSFGRVDVIVVHYGHKDLTRRCLGALAADTALLRSVTIVDSGSQSPLSVADVRSWCHDRSGSGEFDAGSDVHLISCSDNVGFSAGNNLGLAARLGEGADYYLILNNDAYVAPGSLMGMVQAAETSGAGMVAPAVYSANDTDVVDRFGLTLTRTGAAYDRKFEADGPLLCPSGCAALYRRDVVLALMEDAEGFFDQGFVAYAEDLDVGLRARARGFGVVFAPSAVILHEGGGSFGKGSDLSYSLRHRNTVWAIAKNYSRDLLLRDAPFLLLGQLLALFNAAQAGRFRLFLKSRRDAASLALKLRKEASGRPRFSDRRALDRRLWLSR